MDWTHSILIPEPDCEFDTQVVDAYCKSTERECPTHGSRNPSRHRWNQAKASVNCPDKSSHRNLCHITVGTERGFVQICTFRSSWGLGGGHQVKIITLSSNLCTTVFSRHSTPGAIDSIQSTVHPIAVAAAARPNMHAAFMRKHAPGLVKPSEVCPPSQRKNLSWGKRWKAGMDARE